MKKIIYVLIFLAFAGFTNAQWVQSNSGITSGSVGKVSFPDINTGYAYVIIYPNSFIFKTTNAASSWVQVSSFIGDTIQTICFINALTGFAAGRQSKIYITTNGGQNWNLQYTGVTGNKGLKKINFLNSTTGFAVGGYGKVYKTTNSGNNWNVISTAATSFLNDIFFTDMNTGYTCGDYDILKTTDGGNSWVMLFDGISGDPEYWSLFFTDANTGYFSHSQQGYKYTTNGGTNFSNIIVDTTFGTIFSGVYFTNTSVGYLTSASMVNGSGRIYKTTNAGINWNIQLNLATVGLNSVRFFNSLTGYVTGGFNIQPFIYKTTNGGGVWVKNISSEVPDKFSLSQNYPNPFNPTTNIKFQVISSNVVKLVVFDILGKEIATLVNEKLTPGTYETTFDAPAYPSGVYFYKLFTDGFTESRSKFPA
ncbi:MAG: YCF48-related protein [Ignavibacteriae bacterium]|nr:YCF48-related protein [Ignavibacteriota bacterium]